MEAIEKFLMINNGYGSGDGSGSGYGDGSGSGDGYGSGYGSGSGYGLKSIGGKRIYEIDGVPTVITSARDGVATGFIVQSDLTLSPCYIVKENNRFAHGENLHEAYNDLMEKLYDDSSEEERLEKFRGHFPDFSRKYPAEDLFVWHHILTGSCRAGREAFCRDRGIDVKNSEYTVYEFVEMTKDAYGGGTIRKL